MADAHKPKNDECYQLLYELNENGKVLHYLGYLIIFLLFWIGLNFWYFAKYARPRFP